MPIARCVYTCFAGLGSRPDPKTGLSGPDPESGSSVGDRDL